MFQRRNGQKPGEGFYADFKKNYSYLGQSPETPITPAQSLKHSLSMNLPQSFENQDASNEHGMDSAVDWKFDQSAYLDPETYESFSGYWPPTPTVGGSSNWLSNEESFSNPQTSSIDMSTGLETPLSRSMPNSAFPGPHSGNLTMNDVLPSEYHPSTSLFGNHFQGYHMNQFHSEAATAHVLNQRDAQDYHTGLTQQSINVTQASNPQPMEQASRFRFRVTLHTATAMVKSADEIPLTYLNKCQTYKLSIKDTVPHPHANHLTRYRTHIRVSFDDEQQREKPGHCWQLWKEGRGMNEAHQRGGRLQAVEFVHPGPGQSPGRGPNFELLSEAFDGVCIAWNAVNASMPECEVQLKFNFLSTDFSHSKGVKGIPVRLCAKTEIMAPSDQPAYPTPEPEVCYCKVKLFRDHGAERKIANDEAHVKKNIEKITQQISQAQVKMTEGGKRRRSDSITGNPRPSKVAKVKRASSVSSLSSGGGKDSADDDLHGKLASLTAMLRSRKTESLLFLDGDEQDDPDKYPVSLQGVPTAGSGASSPEIRRLERRSTQLTSTSAGSPTLSAASVASPQRLHANLQLPTPINPTPPKPMSNAQSSRDVPKVTVSANPQNLASPPDVSTKVERTPTDQSAKTTQWIDAMGVDKNYQAPAETSKPVACFYILPTIDGAQPTDTLYRAIYLRQRSLRDFTEAIARKCNIDSSLVDEVIHLNQRGIPIKFEDDEVLELPEGQDMQVDLSIRTKPNEIEEHAEEVKPTMAYTITLRF